MGYTSRTGTRTTLAELRARGWRLLVSAKGVHRTEGMPYAIDNGAWTAFQKGKPFDHGAFERLVYALGDGADWIVAPDVVADRAASLRMTEWYLPHLERWPLLVAVQNGMTPNDVRAWLGPRVGLAVGGDDAWKDATVRLWGELARERGCYLHVLRVNTEGRMRLAHEAGADSIDGTSPIQFPSTLGRMDRWLRQGGIVW
jgi:hypothetical protein